MYAVYLCGATDCFLSAMFMSEAQARVWAMEHSKNPEGFTVVYWADIYDIDKSATGWQQ